MLARVRSFLSALLHRRPFEKAMDDELRFHVDAYVDDLVRAGVPSAEAHRRARLEFGALNTVKDECRQSRGLRLVDEARQDARYAFRMMRGTPAFTAAAILSLALGIGASTAIFSLLDAVLFRTLPLDRPEELYFLAHDPGPGVNTSANYPLYERYRTAPVFSGVTASLERTLRVTTAEGVQRVSGQFVSGNYHAVVGAPIVLGRGFVSEPDRQPGASSIGVISHDYWVTRFGGDPSVIGRALTIDGRTITIVGVTAAQFRGLNPGGRVDVTLPMSVLALDSPDFLDDHGGWISLLIVGRLAPGIEEQYALAAVDLIFQQFVDEPQNRWVRKATRDTYRSAALVPAARGTWGLRTQYGRPLWLSMAIVGIVLLMACVNIANLLLARATARGREVALRLCIGADRVRLARQLLTESLLLALGGGLAGVLVAVWGTEVLTSFLAVGPSPVLVERGLNGRVLAFTAGVVALTGLGFGLVPALRSTKVDLTSMLKDGPLARHGSRRPTLGKALVAAQIALCVVIVSAAGLLSRSLANLHGFETGFDRENILLADLDTAATSLSPDATLQLYSDLLSRLRALPGVEFASVSFRTPIDFSSQLRRIDVPGVPWTPGQGVSTNVVSSEYFQTFGIAIMRGRTFSEYDRPLTTPVAVVSASTARFYFPESDPVGRTFQLGGEKHKTTIIGVVEDVRHERLRVEAAPKMVYTYLPQHGAAVDGTLDVPSQLTLALRTEVDPGVLAATVQNEVRALNKAALVPYVRTMEQQIGATLIPEHLLAALSGGFAVVALLLACVGLYGVMAYNVNRRSREIGIRIALGAIPRGVLYQVLRETLTVSGIGIAVGVGIALATTRAVASFLFGITPYDTGTLLGTMLLLLMVAAVAGFIPARHAAHVDPVKVLRNE